MKRDSFIIEADELMAKLDDPNLRIYDATILFFRKDSDLTAYETYEKGHIPGAAFFDHLDFSDPNRPNMYMVLPEAELVAQIGKVGIDNDSEVVVYVTELLPSATRAWWVLRYAGVENVRVLNGGLAAWQQAGGAVEKGVNQYPPTTFEGNFKPEMFASKEDVLRAMEDGNVCTVNTLTPEIYAKGHIVGSSLLPCSDLMHEMASFVSHDEIAARLKEEPQHKRIITYCGGGIAATVNGMAHLMAGNENVAVYDGSMNEWTREGLPIATGSMG